MISETREVFKAQYLYPGVFMPETKGREIKAGTFEAALAAQPDANWYAVTVRKTVQRLYRSSEDTERWLAEGEVEKVGSWIVGEKIHYEDIPDTPENEILRSNIRINTKDGYGVKTRCGNWQFADDYTAVI